MAHRRAFENLITAGTNALCEAGLSLRYEDVSDAQRLDLGMSDGVSVSTNFDLFGVGCVAAAIPNGCGEEKIIVIYDSDDVERAEREVSVAGRLQATRAKCWLERKDGPYIMETDINQTFFRTTNANMHVLSHMVVEPDGYTLNGPFIF